MSNDGCNPIAGKMIASQNISSKISIDLYLIEFVSPDGFAYTCDSILSKIFVFVCINVYFYLKRRDDYWKDVRVWHESFDFLTSFSSSEINNALHSLDTKLKIRSIRKEIILKRIARISFPAINKSLFIYKLYLIHLHFINYIGIYYKIILW